MSAFVFNIDCCSSPCTQPQFLKFGKNLSAALTTVGIPKTTDTGQVDWNGIITQPPVNTYPFYEIRQFSDPLQATTPFYMKFTFGLQSVSGNTNQVLSFQITVGTQTDGAGNLTGPNQSVTTRNGGYHNNNSALGPYPNTPCFISSDGGRLQLVMCPSIGARTGTTGYGSLFSITRTVDSSGNYTADGVNIVHWLANVIVQSQYLPSGNSTTALGPFPVTTVSGMPPSSFPFTGFTGGGNNVGVFAVYPSILGYDGNFDASLFIYSITDLQGGRDNVTTLEGVFMAQLPVYGASRNYIATGSLGGSNIPTNGNSTARTCFLVRFD